MNIPASPSDYLMGIKINIGCSLETTNSDNCDQTAPPGAVWSRLSLFDCVYLSEYLRLNKNQIKKHVAPPGAVRPCLNILATVYQIKKNVATFEQSDQGYHWMIGYIWILRLKTAPRLSNYTFLTPDQTARNELVIEFSSTQVIPALAVLTLCMLDNFSCFCCHLIFFRKFTFSNFFLLGTLSECQIVVNGLGYRLWPTKCSNCLQRLKLADDKVATSRLRV